MTATLDRKRYNPYQIRRRIRHLGILPGNIHQFACYSMTRTGKEVEHHQDIDLETGRVQCSCEHFRFSKKKHGTHFTWIEGDEPAPCKHLERAGYWLHKNGFLDHLKVHLRPCQECGTADAEYELADEHGHEVRCSFICKVCVLLGQALHEEESERAPSPADFDEWLAWHGCDPEMKQAEIEYYEGLRRADDYADFMANQAAEYQAECEEDEDFEVDA